MSIIWRKVWRDLWGNKFRTLLVVLSTAVGVFALGLVFGLSDVMRTRMTESHRAGVPAHVTLGTSTFDQDVVDTVLDVPGVADAEGETWASVRWKSEGETEWRDGIMIARADYEMQRMNLLDLLDGAWPAHSGIERALAAERMTSRHYNVPLGTTILVEFGRSERRLPIEGVVRYSDAFPPSWSTSRLFSPPLRRSPG
jgi:putative ABC transport system permease protein